MVIQQNNRQPILHFLLRKWQVLTPIAVMERIWYATTAHAQTIQQAPPAVVIRPTEQIAIIKQHIISILPEAKFINYNYEAPCPLISDDFNELYINEQFQCIDKVQELIKKLKVQ